MNAQETKAVVSRIMSENIVSLSEARAALHEVTGKRPDKSTLHRWIHRGVGGVKLEAVRMGYQIFTSHEAITRFIESRTKTL